MARSRWDASLRTLGWVAAGGMGVVTAARLCRSSSEPVLIGLQGVAGWALLPALPLVGLALWKRQTALSSLAVALVAVQVSLAAGAVGRDGPRALPAHQTPLRLVTANVLFDNPDLRRLADDIAADGADVVVLQEVTPEGMAELRASALWEAYPYRSAAPRPSFHGAATFSRYPIVDDGPVDVGGPPMLFTDVSTPAGVVRVVNVHAMAPLTRTDARTWATQIPALAGVVADSTVPVVLAGDFNATLDHAPLDRLVDGALVDGGLRDAFRVAGTGIGATWPAWNGPVPPLMRLDHVLVSEGVGVGSATVRAGTGSDHRRLLVELGVPAQAGPDAGAGSGAADGSNR